MDEPLTLTVAQAADRLGVSVATVKRWAADEKRRPFPGAYKEMVKLASGGLFREEWRIPVADVEAKLEEMQDHAD